MNKIIYYSNNHIRSVFGISHNTEFSAFFVRFIKPASIQKSLKFLMSGYGLAHIGLISCILTKYHRGLFKNRVFSLKRKELKNTNKLFKKEIKKIWFFNETLQSQINTIAVNLKQATYLFYHNQPSGTSFTTIQSTYSFLLFKAIY